MARDKKLVYSAPIAVPLGEIAAAAGAKCDFGPDPTGSCRTGMTPASNCSPGSGAVGGSCTPGGNALNAVCDTGSNANNCNIGNGG